MQNNILAKINYILAKLTDEQYAPFKEIYKNMKEEYDKRYEDIFGVGQNRLYLDTTINMSAEDYTKANFNFLMTRLNRLFMVVLKRKYKFKDPFTDLINNRVYEDTGREYRLTKLLQRLKDKNIKDITEEQYEDVDNIFNEYKSYYKEGMIQHYISLIPPKELFKDNMMELLVVISKDPYDIAGMSTDRRWTSCMKLSNGEFDRAGAYSSTLKEDVKLGTLVAYLIAKNDKNIDKPYARMAIKPHHNIEKKSVYLFSEDRVYHDNSLGDDTYQKFKSTVDKFLSEVQDESEGIFMLPAQLYNDSNSRVKTQGNLIKHIDFDYMFRFEDGKKVLKNFPITSDYTFEFDVYIFNNKKYNQSYENNLVTVVEDGSVFFNNITNDEKIYNVYSIYITKAKEPIEKHIVRIDITIGVVPELIKTEYNKVIVDRQKIYIEKLCVKDNLKDDEDFIYDIFNFVKYIYSIRVKK